MGILEIILLAAGAVIFIVSFCIPVKEEKLKEETRNLAAEEVKNLVSEELDTVRSRLTELSEEEMKQQIEKSERTMERISNEKIMAVNEYSDTVLEEIHKNHEEVVFLYDMLKNKKEGLAESYGKADQNMKELLQQVKDSEISVREGLAEIAKKLKEFEEKKEEAVSQAAEKRKPAASRRNKKAPEEQAANSQLQEQPAQEELRQEKPLPEQENSFRPFVPEKVEAAPKKARTGKNGKKSEAESASAAGSPDVMLLLSDTMESDAVGNSNERILELHKAGKSNMAIARELGLGIGEVKLVIDLYQEVK